MLFQSWGGGINKISYNTTHSFSNQGINKINFLYFHKKDINICVVFFQFCMCLMSVFQDNLYFTLVFTAKIACNFLADPFALGGDALQKPLCFSHWLIN